MAPASRALFASVALFVAAAGGCSKDSSSSIPAAAANDAGTNTDTDNDAPVAVDDAGTDGGAEGDAGETGSIIAPQLLIDTDMGLDDARVIVSLPMQAKYHVVGVVTVEGAAGAVKGADNALRLLATLGIDSVPVAVGSTKTASGTSIPAPSWRPMAEGLSGLSLAPAKRSPEAVDGVTFERNLLRNAAQPIDVLAIGPVSNLALALTAKPALTANVRAIYLLGDFVVCAGYNCTTDPDGAKIVGDSGVPMFMLLAKQTDTVPFDAAFLSEVKALNGPAAMLVAGFMSSHADGYMKLWDDGVLTSMLDQNVITYDGAGKTQKSTALDVQGLHGVLLGLWDKPAATMP